MANPFARTTRALSRDSGALASLTLLAATGFLIAWLSWIFLGSVPLYESSDEARLEASAASLVVAAPIAGQVVGVEVGLNERVEAGDVLVRLSAALDEPGTAEAEAEVREVATRLEALRQELSHRSAAGAQASLAEEQARAASTATLLAAEARAEFAMSKARRDSALHASDVLSRAEAERSAAEARGAAGEVAAARAALEGLRHSHASSARQREIAEADLLRRISEAEAHLDSRRARATRIGFSSDRSIIRAPVGGVVGGIAETLQPGSVLARGEAVAWIVPDGQLRLVADFPHKAMALVREGQRARLRLDGFPWMEYGVVDARVAVVGRQPRGGGFRVEMSIVETPEQIQLAHGLAGSVEIQVERVKPYTLLLRAAGMSRSSRVVEQPAGDG